MPSTASWAYWLDYVLFPLAIAAVTMTDRSQIGSAWLALVGVGVASFTYLEYWAHRAVLHGIMWHGQHERHHAEPHEYVVFPVLAVPAIFLGVLIATTLLIGSAGFWVGFAIGYVWFISWHHVLHHMELGTFPAWVRSYQAWHLKHHDGQPCNYGITHPLWDLLHCTSR